MRRVDELQSKGGGGAVAVRAETAESWAKQATLIEGFPERVLPFSGKQYSYRRKEAVIMRAGGRGFNVIRTGGRGFSIICFKRFPPAVHYVPA